MRRIDSETVQRILDTAEIVEVVSDYVRLKKRGSNYIGLCPFHAERTPSFSVSKSRGICKCFSCGKGGSPVGFIMELEKCSYSDALRLLAKKYNIEIKEEEVSEEEQQADRQRESMFAINEWAAKHYSDNLFDTEEGRNIGLSYFRERGLTDATIKRFGLGYSLNSYDLPDSAKKDGYSTEYLIETGLCYRRESSGKVVDRFRERVIYPVYTLSGKVVAFGGRTLSTSKEIAKYVNSPESLIYKKKKELYGIYQAKKSIATKGYCILVEGYMDVLSMSQAGVENVVASSGTSLTEEQIRLIHRFSDKVTLIYDSDPAGIKAALRGVDLLLAQGLDISIVLLPEGEDPDSFAQSHTSTQVEEYLSTHSEDFIKFKTRILLGEADNDPLSRSRVLEEIVKSIAAIPDEIKRLMYCQECSRDFRIKEETLTRRVAYRRAKDAENRRKQYRGESREDEENETAVVHTGNKEATRDITQIPADTVIPGFTPEKSRIRQCEEEIIKYIVRYAFYFLCDAVDEEGNSKPMTVIEYLRHDLTYDDIQFTTPVYRDLYNTAVAMIPLWEEQSALEIKKLEQERKRLLESGVAKIKEEAQSLQEITKREKILGKEIDDEISRRWSLYSCQFFESRLLSGADSVLRTLAMKLVSDKHQLSRYHTRYSSIPTEADRLQELLGQALNAWKYSIIDDKISEIVKEISSVIGSNDAGKLMELMKRKVELDHQKSRFAYVLGERVLGPPN